MASVTITSLTYRADTNQMYVLGDFTAFGTQDDNGDWVDAAGLPLIEGILVPPEAIGNRIVADGYANGDEALTAIVLEHVARIAPDATGTTVDWRVPSDEEKAAQLDALADRIEAAQVFYTPAG